MNTTQSNSAGTPNSSRFTAHSTGVTGATLVSHPDGHPTATLDDHEVDRERIDVGGIFYGVGHIPNTDFLEKTPVDLADSGHLETLEGMTTETTVDGVFGAGDVMDPDYRQAITSAGTGSMAALDAEAWLEEHTAMIELQA